VNLIASIKSIEGIQEVAITTNGLLLDAMLDDLICAGLDRVNLSLDTLDEKKFETISRFKGLDKILRGLEGCMSRHIPVKINAVALKGINDQEVDDLIKLTYKWPVDVRFIELMPIGCGKSFTGVSTDDLYHRIGQLGYDYHRVDISRGNGPADYIQLRGALGKVGFISPLSHQFCHACNRIRITPEGFLKPCLHAKTGIDMKRALKAKITDEALVELLEKGIMMKPTSHNFLDQSVDQDVRSMNQIGG